MARLCSLLVAAAMAAGCSDGPDDPGDPSEFFAAAATFKKLDAAPFVLDPGDSFSRFGALVSELEASGKVHAVESLNTALAGPRDFHPRPGLCHSTGIAASFAPSGFCWDPRDEGWETATWRAQGVTGSWDAQPNGLWDGRKVVVASWHGPKHENTFARLTFNDVTDSSYEFRDVLLVVPGGSAGFRTFDWNHADGVLWYGSTLLVANGGRLHAFSLKHLWRMDRLAEDIGLGSGGDLAPSARWHRYALPMIGEYYPERTPGPGEGYIGCNSITGTRPCLNSISLDRRGAATDSMVSAEFVGPNQAGGRAFRWPMDASTALPALAADGKVHAEEAYSSPIWHMQGIASNGTDWYIAGTCAGGAGGCIHKARPSQSPHQQTRVYGGLENLSYQPGSPARLWGVTEGTPYVFSMKAP